MSLLSKTFFRARNFVNYSKEFGVRAAWQVVRNNSRPDPVVVVQLPGIRTPIYYRPRSSDFAVLRQTFGKRESDVFLRDQPQLIIDGGANIGLVSLLYANKYPDTAIVAVEPDADNCAIFRQNCGEYRNITLVEAALWPRKETLWLTNPDREPFAFRVTEEKTESAHIKTVTVADILAGAGRETIDLLKLDIEGAEREIFLTNPGEWMPCVNTMIVELHDRFAPGCSEAFFSAISSRPNRHYRSGEYWIVEFDTMLPQHQAV